MAGRPFASKRLPFEDFIRGLRASNMPYHEIAKLLETEHGLKVHPDTINSFVIVRAKRPQLVYTLPPKPQAPASPPASLPPRARLPNPSATKRRPFASKLLPFEDFIRGLRANNVPYHEIAKLLESEHGLKVHPDTINSFVIVRAKRPQLVYTLPPKRERLTSSPPRSAAAPSSAASAPAAAPSPDAAPPVKPRKWNTEF